MPEFWPDVWDLVKSAGPFGAGLMLIMWWLERTERLKTRAQLDELLEGGLKSGTTALERLADILSRSRTP